jgi:hypothetical protein
VTRVIPVGARGDHEENPSNLLSHENRAYLHADNSQISEPIASGFSQRHRIP